MTGRRPAVAFSALCLALLTACAGGSASSSPGPGPSSPGPGPSSPGQSPSPGPTPAGSPQQGPAGSPERGPSSPPSAGGSAADRFDTWQVGARPLPLRADGYGEVRRTPTELRVRRLRTTDRLPPPPDGRFEATVRPVTEALVRRTGLAWSPGCPVGLSELRLIELAFWGFDDLPHTGRLVVNRSVAGDVVTVFRDLYEARFPIEEMRLVTQADLDAPPTGDGNNTAAYACRPTVGAESWSAHAYGLAVDLNPFQNPYLKGDLVLPELASAYLNRSWRRPGMIHPGGVVVRAFERIGWTWGGTFRTVLDLHHFSATGR